MNLTQIKTAYTANLNAKLAECFTRIERSMISNFKEIERGLSFKMIEENIGSYSSNFDDTYREDMIKGIQQKYAENWEVVHSPETKKLKSSFTFKYKGPPSGKIEHIEVNSIIVKDKEEPIDRTSILDLREVR